jgi:hypothetical protein
MRNLLPRSASLRALALGVPVAALMLVVLGSGLAGADTTTPEASGAVVHIKIVKGNLKFVAPATVDQGDQLEIVNETNPKQVGPHTFSLVTKGSQPKTPSARKNCFTPNHICMAIAKWQGFNGKTLSKNPAKAGAEGWSTMGSLTKKGDSWFTGEKPKTSFSQVVSAPAGTTLYFMCAIHPWMQGKIKVLPAGS